MDLTMEETKAIGLITQEMVDILRSNTKKVSDNLHDNYYTKDEIQQMLVAGITTKLVTELPEVGEEGIVYLVPVDPTLKSENNYYKEYLYTLVDGEYKWEALGSTELNFADYYKKEKVDQLLAGKLPKDIFIPSKISEVVNDKGFIKFEIVSTLPTTGEAGVIYAIPAPVVYEDGNKYDEYVYVNGAWERIGYSGAVSQALLKSNYYKKDQTYSTSEMELALLSVANQLDEEAEKVWTKY